jgi:nitrile hydratase subunit alpha
VSTEHGHDHRPRPDSQVALCACALEALLAEQGLVAADAVDAVVELYERDVGPQNVARVVAHAWTNPVYRERLLADGAKDIAKLGFGGAEADNLVRSPTPDRP